MQDQNSVVTLVVEPDIDCLENIQRALEGMGCQFIGLKSHMQALARFDDISIDIIISTVEPTDIDGVALCRLVRHREEHLEKRYTYFIFLTNETEKGSLFRSQMGADDVLLKPLNLAELKWRVQAAINILKVLKSRHKLQSVQTQSSALTREQLFLFLQEELNRQARKTGALPFILIQMPTLDSLQRDYGHKWRQWVEQFVLQEIALKLRNYDRVARVRPGLFCLLSPDTSLLGLKGLVTRFQEELQDVFSECFPVSKAAYALEIRGYFVEIQPKTLLDQKKALNRLWSHIVSGINDLETSWQSVTSFVLSDED
jgi:PleD family two-component response regulator